jgi:hypothetical protein
MMCDYRCNPAIEARDEQERLRIEYERVCTRLYMEVFPNGQNGCGRAGRRVRLEEFAVPSRGR